jgi:hypothetical protein
MRSIKIIVSFLFLFLIFFIAVSCSRLNLGSVYTKNFLKNDSLKNIVWKDIYINDGVNLYKLNNAKISADSIKGETTLISDSRRIEKELLNKKGKGKHNRKLILYTKSPIHAYASQDLASAYSDNKISFGRNEVLNKKELTFDNWVLIGVGIFLLLLIIGVVIVVLLTISAAASGPLGGACYVATMVYGDYDAPEVMILRRFRDEVLAKYVAGIIFIKIYYRYSPLFVERFRHSQKVNSFIKVILDRLVKSLS